MQERRALHSWRVTQVDCGVCQAPVPLEATKMVMRATHAELQCPACGALVPVRHTDMDITAGGIWTCASHEDDAAHAAQLEQRALLLLRH